MGSIDSIQWQVLTVVLTVTGLGASAVLWKVRGAASGIRGIAWSLLPAAAYFTGLLRLLWEVGDSAVSWAARFVFGPVAWLGIAIAGVSATLFVVASAMRRRGVGTRGRTSRPTKGEALPSSGSRAPAKAPAADDDMADIEAILKKHGIT